MSITFNSMNQSQKIIPNNLYFNNYFNYDHIQFHIDKTVHNFKWIFILLYNISVFKKLKK